MGVEAARLVLKPSLEIDRVKFATPTPAYADKNNASTIHAALRLGSDVGAWDIGGSLRSATGTLISSINEPGTTLLVSADIRDGLPTSADESSTGDGAAAAIVGEGSPEHPVIADLIGTASRTDEFLDRWRAPGEQRSRVWEERFGETRYVELGLETYEAALGAAGIVADEVDRLVVTGLHGRAVKAVGSKLAKGRDIVSDPLTPQTGQIGGAHPLIALTQALEEASPGDVIALVHLADGADVLVFRTTEAIKATESSSTLSEQLSNGAPISYAKFLSWRSMVNVEPPRRPEPARVSSSAAWRSEDWKFGFVGTRDTIDGTVHLPPARVSKNSDSLDVMEPVAMADALGTIITFTIDRMAYSPSPPVVFAVVDFDGGGRFPVELTDVDAESVAIGDRVAMTFRRLFTADGIHDYFWKARPVRSNTHEEG
jgi:3-hydroxy-3-methylglutaryl CoA synthase